MNLIERQPPRVERAVPLRPHYEGVAISTLGVLLRRKWLIASMALAGLVLGVTAILVLEKKYTAEALIQLDVGREDQSRAGKAVAPTVTMDAGVVVETEARVIRSRAMARRVVERLHLERNPAFAPSDSLVTRILARLGLSLSPEESTSRNNLIAIELGRHLAVTNDIRSYLISIAFTSNSPGRSATIANAFAEEYLQNRRQEIAKRDLADLISALGPKHPSVLQARARLAGAQNKTSNQPSPQLVMPAEPIAVPSGPNRLMIFVFSIAGAIGLAVGLAFLLERRDTGFRTEVEIEAQTGRRCVGIIPEVSRRASPVETYACTEAVRLIGAAAGLGVATGSSRVALITSSVSGEGKSLLCHILARSLLSTSAERVLIIDISPRAAMSHPSSIPVLEDALSAMEVNLPFFDRLRNQSIVTLQRSSSLADGASVFHPHSFEKLIAQARNLFDVILIEAPPVMLVADVFYVHRFTDVVLHLVRWSSTTRDAVGVSLKRMQDLGVRVDGLVLSRVDHQEQQPSGHGDSSSYYAKYATRNVAPAAASGAQRETAKLGASERIPPQAIVGASTCA